MTGFIDPVDYDLAQRAAPQSQGGQLELTAMVDAPAPVDGYAEAAADFRRWLDSVCTPPDEIRAASPRGGKKRTSGEADRSVSTRSWRPGMTSTQPRGEHDERDDECRSAPVGRGGEDACPHCEDWHRRP
jgi:hypothetical protein